MNRKKFLMIVEKPSIRRLIERVYESMIDSANYDLDVAVANNFVFDINDKFIVREDNFDEMNQHLPLQLKSRQADECFRLITSDDEGIKGRNERIFSLVNTNHYDAILNACDMDEPGDLIFVYTIESLGLDEYPTIRFITNSLSDAYLTDRLLDLNNQK